MEWVMRCVICALICCAMSAGYADARTAKWYATLDAGVTLAAQQDVLIDFAILPASKSKISFDAGWAAAVGAGREFANGLRLEFEAGYRSNNFSHAFLAEGDLHQMTLSANMLYDIDLSPSVALSVGGGVGYDRLTLRNTGWSASDERILVQGLLGLSYRVGGRTELTATYDFTLVGAPAFSSNPIGLPSTLQSIQGDDFPQSAIAIGLRYFFDT